MPRANSLVFTRAILETLLEANSSFVYELLKDTTQFSRNAEMTSGVAIPPIIQGVRFSRSVSCWSFARTFCNRHDAVQLLVKTPPFSRFTISIDYKAYLAFYSIGMYKGGWTDYFLAPALDCRESRTHFLCTRAHILVTSHRLYCTYVLPVVSS